MPQLQPQLGKEQNRNLIHRTGEASQELTCQTSLHEEGEEGEVSSRFTGWLTLPPEAELSAGGGTQGGFRAGDEQCPSIWFS